MSPREFTEIRIAEDGSETHESWIKIGANKISGQTHLFDSEIAHQHWVRVRVERCRRRRDLGRDWFSNDSKSLIEFDMSEAQWGAFVSSFGNGSGVPATLVRFDGYGVPEAPHRGRLDESHKEVRDAAAKAVAKVQEEYDALLAAFESGAGKKEMREKIRTLGIFVGNVPGNMEFAAKSMTEHVENVVTKARFDIEAVVLHAQANGATLDAAALGGLLSAGPVAEPSRTSSVDTPHVESRGEHGLGSALPLPSSNEQADTPNSSSPERETQA